MLTIEEAARRRSETPWELIRGELVERPFKTYEQGRIIARLLGLLAEPQTATDVGGQFLVGTGFVLARNPDTLRAPDVAFVRAERDEPERRGFFPGPPDLALEGVSPEDRQQEVEAKANAWLEAGTPLVWVIWPATHSVTMHRPAHKPAILHEGHTLDGEAVILIDELPNSN